MQKILEDLKRPEVRERLRDEAKSALLEDRLEFLQRKRKPFVKPVLKNPALRYAIHRAVR